jgi:cobyrinic acid a,c-diamide synthase
MNGLLIAGTASGVGKTTLSLAILAALRRRGLRVQPFKGGPDFLDTGHHTRIAGRSARNLDTWMLSAESNLQVVAQAARNADFLLVEGMMGLFDGKRADTDTGSSAEIAKLLKLPVILVVDASKTARSAAAVVLGFELFDPDLPLAGVILNRVASPSHYHLLEAAITARCKAPILGWFPRNAAVAIPERHLGLQTTEEASAQDASSTQWETFADLAEQHLNMDHIAALECGLRLPQPSQSITSTSEKTLRIGVARDTAFSFYYEDNLDLLREQGATIVPFSPLHDAHLPPDLDAIYLGGGYPELHAERLSGNTTMRSSIRAFAAEDKPIYAECGGMIYLSAQLKTADGTYPMAAVLPFAMEMTGKLVHFGYATIELTRDCLLGTAGTTLRGHSFHYSRIVDDTSVPTAYAVKYSLSGREENEGYLLGSVLASYIHLHFRAAPSIAEHFVAAARNSQPYHPQSASAATLRPTA